MLASEAILPPRQLLPAVPHTVTVSLALHALVIAGALLLGAGAPDDVVSLESIAVSVISIETASESTAPARSDAAQTLVAAGAVSPLTAETITPPEPTTPLTPVETADVAPPVEAVEPSAAVQVAPTPPVDAATAIEAETVVNTAAMSVDEAVPELVAEAEKAAPEAVAAEIAPLAEAEQPIAETDALTAEVVEPVVAQTVEPEAVREAVDPPPLPAKVERKSAPVEKAAPPKKHPPVERARPQPASSGAGGQHDANAVAAAPARGGAGKRAAGGSGATSRYPGLVEARLKRALRFPRGADRSVGRVRVSFTVHAGGNASAVHVSASSGSAILDAAAMDTVRRAAPFPPIPTDAGRSSWTFTVPLTFRR